MGLQTIKCASNNIFHKLLHKIDLPHSSWKEVNTIVSMAISLKLNINLTIWLNQWAWRVSNCFVSVKWPGTMNKTKARWQSLIVEFAICCPLFTLFCVLYDSTWLVCFWWVAESLPHLYFVIDRQHKLKLIYPLIVIDKVVCYWKNFPLKTLGAISRQSRLWKVNNILATLRLINNDTL